MSKQQTLQQMTQAPKEASANHNVQLGSTSELKKWANRIGPRSVAAAARYRNEPETKHQE